MKTVLFLLANLVFLHTDVNGQKVIPHHIATAAVFYTSFKPSLYVGYTFQKKQFNLSARIIGFADDRKADVDNEFPVQKYLDFGILAGWNILQSKRLELLLQSGISYVSAIKQGNFIREEFGWTGTKYTYYEERKVSGLGFPVEVKAIIPLSESVGITTIGYANLNGKINTTGVGLGIVLIN